MEILAALLNAQFGAAQVDTEQGVVLLEVRLARSPACLVILDIDITAFRPVNDYCMRSIRF